jgi:hypothetical protein
MKEVDDKARELFQRAYKSAKARFGQAWGILPRELRVLYVQSAVLSAIAAIDVSEIPKVESKARIAEYCNHLALMASQLDNA